MSRLTDWIKLHKLTTVLILVVGYFLFRSFFSRTIGINSYSYSVPTVGIANPATANFGAPAADTFGSIESGIGKVANSALSYAPSQNYAPAPQVTNRMVVQNSYLSLLVKEVVSARKQITDYAISLGGYMVSAETSNPQDAPTSTVTVRVPSDSLDTTLEKFRSLGVKVVSENLVGQDVTDQYVDIDARIATLQKTKAAMEDLLSRATLISDLTNITQQIISVQSQIDALKGQQKSLSENAKYAKVTIYLSTDEIALPYAPNETFRPAVVFKLAVRALISTLRSLATTLIWVAVYGIIWVPALIILFFVNRFINRRNKIS